MAPAVDADAYLQEGRILAAAAAATAGMVTACRAKERTWQPSHGMAWHGWRWLEIRSLVLFPGSEHQVTCLLILLFLS